MQNLIEELTKVDPANLSEEGLKLFNKINEIIDKNKELEEKIKGMVDKSSKLIEVTNLYLNSIPKSLVKEKIEELNDTAIVQVLEELLGEEK